MVAPVLHKRTATASKIPLTSDFVNEGQLIINSYDGKLFMRKNVSGTQSVVDIIAVAAALGASSAPVQSVNGGTGAVSITLASLAGTQVTSAVYAGPTSGSATPTWRVLGYADITGAAPAASPIFSGEAKFSNGTYADPDSGVARSVKVAGLGLAVTGGIKSDTLNVTSTTSLRAAVSVFGTNTGAMALAGPDSNNNVEIKNTGSASIYLSSTGGTVAFGAGGFSIYNFGFGNLQITPPTTTNGNFALQLYGTTGSFQFNSAVGINSGAINNTTVGATTASTGAFTTLTGSSATLGNLSVTSGLVNLASGAYARVQGQDQYHQIALRTDVTGAAGTLSYAGSDLTTFVEYGGIWKFRQVTPTSNAVVFQINPTSVTAAGSFAAAGAVSGAGLSSSTTLSVTGASTLAALTVTGATSFSGAINGNFGSLTYNGDGASPTVSNMQFMGWNGCGFGHNSGALGVGVLPPVTINSIVLDMRFGNISSYGAVQSSSSFNRLGSMMVDNVTTGRGTGNATVIDVSYPLVGGSWSAKYAALASITTGGTSGFAVNDWLIDTFNNTYYVTSVASGVITGLTMSKQWLQYVGTPSTTTTLTKVTGSGVSTPTAVAVTLTWTSRSQIEIGTVSGVPVYVSSLISVGAVSAASMALTAALPVTSGGTGVTTSTGSGANVLATGPAFAGVSFGSTAVASATDLSKHIALWGTSFGFSITSSTLNYLVNGGSTHAFLVGGTQYASVSSSGIATTALAVSGTTATVNGRAVVSLAEQNTVSYDGTGVDYNSLSKLYEMRFSNSSGASAANKPSGFAGNAWYFCAGGGDTTNRQWQLLADGNANIYSRVNLGGWGSWKTLLSDNNFNTYAPTLTGTGASGTWGINVSGTAYNITAFAINQNLATTSSPTFASLVSSAGYQAQARSSIISQGAYFQWNHFGDGGTWIINQKGAGSGGIYFGESTTSNVLTQTMQIDASGNLYISGAIVTTAVVGGNKGVRSINAAALYASGATVPTVIANIAALRLLNSIQAITNGTTDCTINVLSYATVGDNGGGLFTYVATDTTSADNGGTIIVDAGGHRWYRANAGEIKAEWFGYIADGTTDNAAAINRALAALPQAGGCIRFPPGKGKINSQITYTYPATYPSSVRTHISLVGSGQEATILYFPASNGIKLAASHYLHGFHVADLSITTGAVGSYTGFEAYNSISEGFYPNNDFFNVSFRGDDFSSGTQYWNTACYANNFSSVNFIGVIVYGKLTASDGIGIRVKGAGNATHNIATNDYLIVANLTSCGLYSCGVGLQYDDFVQGVSVSQSNFQNGVTGIYIPASVYGSAQLSINNSQFNNSGNSILCNSQIASVIATGNLIYVNANNSGILLYAGGNQHIFVGNTITGSSTTGTYGIAAKVVTTLNSTVVGNMFYGLDTAVDLDTASGWSCTGNTFEGCTNSYARIGTTNAVFDYVSGGFSNLGSNPIKSDIGGFSGYNVVLSNGGYIAGGLTIDGGIKNQNISYTSLSTTGGTVAAVVNKLTVINSTGTMSAVTWTLPASPADNDRVSLVAVQTITALTISTSLYVAGNVSTLAANKTIEFLYLSIINAWIRINQT